MAKPTNQFQASFRTAQLVKRQAPESQGRGLDPGSEHRFFGFFFLFPKKKYVRKIAQVKYNHVTKFLFPKTKYVRRIALVNYNHVTKF